VAKLCRLLSHWISPPAQTARVQFFIPHLASWLRTRRFSEPTFRPSAVTNHWKNTVNRDFAASRAPGFSFFWGFLFFNLLSSSLLFFDSYHLCFSSVHIVGSLTSKLPLAKHSDMIITKSDTKNQVR